MYSTDAILYNNSIVDKKGNFPAEFIIGNSYIKQSKSNLPVYEYFKKGTNNSQLYGYDINESAIQYYICQVSPHMGDY